MDKRGFNKMFLIVIAIVVLVVGYRFLTVTPRNTESLQKLSQIESDLTTDDSRDSTETETDNQKETSPSEKDEERFYDEDKQNQLSEELQPHKYHADPYIEARSVISEKALCFATHNSEDARLQLKDVFKTADRLPAFEDMMADCQIELQAYPILAGETESIYWQLKPNSQIGLLLQRMLPHKNSPDLNREDYRQTLTAVLKTKNGPLIAEQATMPFEYFSAGEFLPISNWLKTKNNQYIEQTFQFSLSKLACRYQGGIACEPGGLMMLSICATENSACGLDFKGFYQQTIMPGMKKDIEILEEKFAAMAE